MDWRSLFDVCDPNPPCPPAWLDGLTAAVTSPLLDDEKEQLAAEDAPDLAAWAFPAGPLPKGYRDFLLWANGGTFVAGDREFGVLRAEEVREYMLTYRLPYHLPAAVPFATDGQGGFYLFDMRGKPDGEGEYPVLHLPAGGVGFADATPVSDSLRGAFAG